MNTGKIGIGVIFAFFGGGILSVFLLFQEFSPKVVGATPSVIVATDPEFAAALCSQSRFLHSMGHLALAIQAGEKAMQMNPNDMACRRHLANIKKIQRATISPSSTKSQKSSSDSQKLPENQ